MTYHEPVMVAECISALRIRPDGIYIDATYGGGGHSRKILEHLETGKLIAFDRDADAINNKIDDKRFIMVHDNFSNMQERMTELGYQKADGILADLGISSHQIDVPERGFSTRFDALLDMRMDKRGSFTARNIINEYSENELIRVFSNYGEVRNSKRLAAAIIKARTLNAINTSGELKAAIRSCIPPNKENQYMAQVFQALRIEVNGEMDALKQLLTQCANLLNEGGRLAVISYHSLEDRMVKNMINTGNVERKVTTDIYGNITGKSFKAVNRKAITAGGEEIKRNPRSRSAKLRVAEKA